MPEIIRLVVDPVRPDDGLLKQAAAVIARAGVIAMPTDTFYGLAVNPFSRSAVARVFDVKQRAAEQALPLVAGDREQVSRWLGALNPTASRLAARFWPGPLTLLVPAPSALAPEVSAATGRVGVRVPAHSVARALCLASDCLLTATSANISGQPASNDPDDVAASLDGRIDMLVDAGRTAGGPASTIVDVSAEEPVLVRAGAIPWEDVRLWLSRA